MANVLHDTGEEFAIEQIFKPSNITNPTNLPMGLYNDSTDALSETNDVADITTEPTGSAYARQDVSYDGADISFADNANDNWEVTFADETFDTSDSSQTVDSYFIVVNFTSDDTSDTSANDHLFFTGALSQSRDLSQIDSLTVSNAGATIT